MGVRCTGITEMLRNIGRRRSPCAAWYGGGRSIGRPQRPCWAALPPTEPRSPTMTTTAPFAELAPLAGPPAPPPLLHALIAARALTTPALASVCAVPPHPDIGRAAGRETRGQ